mmetsp:Transcript_37289/g.79193  ORF Transcript_37289/g.79193 Transcript_37289/m.79193 type:complete len:86 (-) Transcript_37289:7-264(-)
MSAPTVAAAERLWLPVSLVSLLTLVERRIALPVVLAERCISTSMGPAQPWVKLAQIQFPTAADALSAGSVETNNRRGVAPQRRRA